MENKDNLLEVIKTIIAYLRYILVVCFLVGIGSIVVALVLPVYFKASTVFVAASPESLSERGIFGTTTRDPQPFGNNNDNDRLLTLASSNELIDFLIDTFDLYVHYDIDTEDPKSMHYIREEFNGLYEVQKTKRDAIQLSVEDKDPQLAAAIANVARDKIDLLNIRAFKQLMANQKNSIDKNIRLKEIRIKILNDSLQAARNQYGIYNIQSQSESLSELRTSKGAKLIGAKAKYQALKSQSSIPRDTILYLQANLKGLEEEVNQLDAMLSNMNVGMPIVEGLEEELEEAYDQLNYDRERLKRLNTAFDANISSIVTYEIASIPLIKSRPFRSLIVIGSVVAAFVLSLLAVLIFDTYKEVNWKELL